MPSQKPKTKPGGKNISVQHTQKKPVQKLRLSTSNLQYLSVLVISILIYINTLFFSYALDDGLFIMDNKITKKGFSGIEEIFSTDACYGVFGNEVQKLLPGGRYRPLSQAMFAIEYQLFGLNPFIGHFFNIILYSLLCLLLLKVLKIIFEKYENKRWYLSLPFIATILFTCHPLHTEVVANIKGRDEILSLLFSLGTLYYVLRYIQKKKFLILLYAFISFSLALLSKENSITFLALIPLTVFFLHNESLKKHLFAFIPLASAVIIYFLLRFNALGFGSVSVESKELLNNPFVGVALPEKIATIFLTWGKYILLVLFPHPLTHDYYPKQIPIVGFGDFRVIISIIIYAFLAVYAVIRIWKRDIYAYAILLFLITFSIASNLVFNIGTFMNERFMFAPLLGFTIILAYLINKYLSSTKFLFAAQIVTIAMVSLYSLKTINRNFAWKDSLTLYTTDVKTSVNSAKVNVGTGELLIKSVNDKTPDSIVHRTIKQALVYIDRGLEIYPGFKAGWIYKGYGQHLLKDYKNSRLSLIEALKISNTDTDAKNYLYNDALTCYNSGDYLQAEENFKTLIQYVPDHTEYQYLLTEVYTNTSRVDTAVTILKDMIRKNPKYDKPYNKLGEIYGRIKNDFDTSFYYLNKAYELNPKNLETLRNLGTAYGIRNEFQKSLRYLLEAEKVAPTDKDILNKLAITYKNLGNSQLSNEYAAKASR
jgi:protein O-mannosyl-transferase